MTIYTTKSYRTIRVYGTAERTEPEEKGLGTNYYTLPTADESAAAAAAAR